MLIFLFRLPLRVKVSRESVSPISHLDSPLSHPLPSLVSLTAM